MTFPIEAEPIEAELVEAENSGNVDGHGAMGKS